MSRRVVSLSLFRSAASPYELPEAGAKRGRFHLDYLSAAIHAYRYVYPDWELWLHHDGSPLRESYGPVLERLHEAGKIKLVDMGPAMSLCGAMLWRLAPLLGSDVDVVICRDIDALPTPRERGAVDEWLSTDYWAHSIADAHAHNAPLLGGLCGFRREAGELPGLGASLRAAWADPALDRHGADQAWLAQEVWPRVRARALRHKAAEAPPLRRQDAPAETRVLSSDRGGAMARLGRFCGSAYPITEARAYLDVQYDSLELEAIRSAELAVGERREPIVVLAVDRNPDYLFLLPLTCLLWSRLGFRPLVLLVGEWQEWVDAPHAWLALASCYQAGGWPQVIGRCPGHRDSTVAQVSRLYACLAYGVRGRDYLVTSDADMWPLSRQWSEAADRDRLTIRYANAYGGEKYPLCYLGAPVAIWQRIMCPAAGIEQLIHVVRRQLDAGLGGDEDAWTAWNYDELLFAVRLGESGVTFARGERRGCPPRDRIDRSDWPKRPSAVGMVDAHLPRPGWVGETWPSVRHLLAQLVEARWLEWADDYQARWLEVV